MQLSKFFTLDEMLHSGMAERLDIDMTPSPQVQIALRSLAVNVLDPLRQRLGHPLIITSGYRPPELNRRIGGAATSQHCRGEAADCRSLKLPPYTLAQLVVSMGLPFDQLILEFGRWVHISHKPSGAQRGEVLTAIRKEGTTHYIAGLHK